MLTSLLTIIGGGLGGLLRFVPEIVKLLTDQKDRDHEYRMTQLQLDIDKARSEQNIDLVHAQEAMQEAAGQMQAYIEAVKGQSTPTGVPWADALSASVRPILTYWWQGLFTLVKGCIVVEAIIEFSTLKAFVADVWTDQDAAVLAMILGFWFVDRSLRKNSGR